MNCQSRGRTTIRNNFPLCANHLPRIALDSRLRTPSERAMKNYMKIKGLDASHHSPARDVEAFNSRFLGDGKVPTEALATGNPGTVSIPSNPSSYKNVQENSGLESPRSNYQCMDAAPNSTPSGKPMGKTQGGDRRDAGGVTSYSDARV